MGLEVLYPKPALSKAEVKKYKYRYLLKGLHIGHPNDVWAIDVTISQWPRNLCIWEL
jgi:putative transposase